MTINPATLMNTLTLQRAFTSNETRYPYCLEATVQAESITPHNIDNVHNVTLIATNAQTGDRYEFNDARIKQAFDHFAGNVTDGVIEYFDWEYIYLLCLEELI